MRMRSPRTAPPESGLDGSTAITATRRPRCPDVTEERGYERALAGSGWPGDADHVSLAGQRKERIKRLQPGRVFVFDQGRQAGQRSSVRPLKAKEEVAGGYHNAVGRGALSRM